MGKSIRTFCNGMKTLLGKNLVDWVAQAAAPKVQNWHFAKKTPLNIFEVKKERSLFNTVFIFLATTQVNQC